MPKIASRADQLIAYRAILSAPGLSPGERAVGCAILSHFNEDTGQCDPGVARLARMVGVKRDTVFAAVIKLQALGILTKTTYGGKSHRNSYAVGWDRCSEIDKANNRPHRGTVKPSREPSPDRDGEPSPDGDTNVYLDKRVSSLRRREGTSGSIARGSSEGVSDEPTRLIGEGVGQRLEDGPGADPRPPHARKKGQGGGALIAAFDSRKSNRPSHADAATGAAERGRQRRIASLPRHEQEAAWLREIEAEEARQRSASSPADEEGGGSKVWDASAPQTRVPLIRGVFF